SSPLRIIPHRLVAPSHHPPFSPSLPLPFPLPSSPRLSPPPSPAASSVQQWQVINRSQRVQLVTHLFPRLLNSLRDPVAAQDSPDVAGLAHHRLNLRPRFLPPIRSIKVLAKIICSLLKLLHLLPDPIFPRSIVQPSLVDV